MSKFKEKLKALLGAEEKPQKTFEEMKAEEEAAKAEKKAKKKEKKKAAKAAAAAGDGKPGGKDEDEVTKKIDAALEKQKIELTAVFNDKLKDVQSNSKPPATVTPETIEAPKDGVDFEKWNKTVEEINKRNSNQNK